MADLDYLRRVAEQFPSRIRHAGAMGMAITDITPEGTTARMPLRPEFLGDSERGLVHTSVITALIDSVCGIAAMARIGHPRSVATLDLRVDYLRPTFLGNDLHCHAECYRLTGQIAFLRATVWQDDRAAPVASSLSTFMVQPSQSGPQTFSE